MVGGGGSLCVCVSEAWRGQSKMVKRGEGKTIM